MSITPISKDFFKVNLVAGDLEPPVRRQLISRSTDLPIDLDGATVRFIMENEAGVKILDASADIEAPPGNGMVIYNWESGDTDTPGFFKARFKITFPSTKPYSMPNTDKTIIVDIQPLLGA